MVKEVQQHPCMCVCAHVCSGVCRYVHECSTYMEVTSVSVLAFHLVCLIWTSFFVADSQASNESPAPPPVFPWNQDYRSSKYDSGLYMASEIQTQVLRFEDNCFHPPSHQYSPWQHLKRTYLNIWKNDGILFHHLLSFIMRFLKGFIYKEMCKT